MFFKFGFGIQFLILKDWLEVVDCAKLCTAAQQTEGDYLLDLFVHPKFKKTAVEDSFIQDQKDMHLWISKKGIKITGVTFKNTLWNRHSYDELDQMHSTKFGEITHIAVENTGITRDSSLLMWNLAYMMGRCANLKSLVVNVWYFTRIADLFTNVSNKHILQGMKTLVLQIKQSYAAELTENLVLYCRSLKVLILSCDFELLVYNNVANLLHNNSATLSVIKIYDSHLNVKEFFDLFNKEVKFLKLKEIWLDDNFVLYL